MKHRRLPQQAWAVLEDELLSLCDYRLPVFWIRSTAKQWMEEHQLQNARVVRVTIDDATDGATR